MSFLDEFFMGLRNVVRDIHTLSQSIHQGQTAMLQQIADLQTSLTALSAQAAANSTKIDSLIALAQASASSGTPVSQEDLDALTTAKTQVDQLAAEVKTADDKADSALTPPAAPAVAG